MPYIILNQNKLKFKIDLIPAKTFGGNFNKKQLSNNSKLY